MRISLLNGSTIYPLAGQAGVAESVHSSAADLRINGEIAKQSARFVRGDNAKTWDRKGLATSIGFSTARTFASVMLAEQWAADYDTTLPRSGVLVLESTGSSGIPSAMTVTADLTIDGTAPAVFPQLAYSSMVVGRPRFENVDGSYVEWDGTYWLLNHGPSASQWLSTDNVATPDLIITWIPDAPATGIPVLIGTYPYCRYLIDAVVDPPDRQVIGCSVILRYTATGGALVAGIPGTWSSDIPWPVGGNWEDS